MSCQTIYLPVPQHRIVEAKTDWRKAERLSAAGSFSEQEQTLEGLVCAQRWGECLGMLWFLSLLDAHTADNAKRLSLLACRGGHWLSSRWDNFSYSIPFYTLPDEVTEVSEAMSTLDWTKIAAMTASWKANQTEHKTLTTTFKNTVGISPPSDEGSFRYFLQVSQHAVRVGDAWRQVYTNAHNAGWGMVVSSG